MEPAVLQIGPETFRVMTGDGRPMVAHLGHEFRRAVAPGVPPLQVAIGLLDFAREHDVVPRDVDQLDLGAVVAVVPGWVDELRTRFR